MSLCLHLYLLISWRSIEAQRQGQRKGEEEIRKEGTLHPLGSSSFRADTMTKFLPCGAFSVDWIVGCPLPSRHPLVELLCTDGGDFVNVRDPILRISLPEPLLGGRRQAVDRALCRNLNE